MSMKLTRKQYAHLVRDIEQSLKSMVVAREGLIKSAKDFDESADSMKKVVKGVTSLKGSGPDDYGAPNTLETYLAQHPLSEMEFWVDHGGVPMGGAGLKDWKKKGQDWKKKLIKFRDLAKNIYGKVTSKDYRAKTKAAMEKKAREKLEQVKDKVEDKADEIIDKHVPEGMKGKAEDMKDAAIKVAHETAKEGIDTAVKEVKKVEEKIGGKGHGCGCKGGGRGNAFAGELMHDKEKHEKDEHQRGRGHMEGHGHKMHGGARAGEDGSYDGAGLLLNQLGFVRAVVPTVQGGVAVPFNNHLQNEPVSGPGGRIPAGGYGDYALPVAGGGWENGY